MRDPRFWLSASLALIAFLVVFLFFAVLFVLDADQELTQSPSERVEIVWRSGAALIALITFVTVIWRGMMTDQQTREQKRQNDANDDAAYAGLLVEGTKLLGEKSDHHKRAGVAILLRVTTDPSSDDNGRPNRLQQQAMDILASEWSQNHETFSAENYTSFLYRALFSTRVPRLFASFDLSCDDHRTVEIDGKISKQPKHDKRWLVSGGFQNQSFFGGKTDLNFIKTELFQGISVKFAHTEINDSEIVKHKNGVKISYNVCTFVDCRIAEIDSDELYGSTFICCDFSRCCINSAAFFATQDGLDEAKILNQKRINYFSDPGNWYDIDNPPVSTDDFRDWSNYLEPRKAINGEWHRLAETGEWVPVMDIPF